MNLWPSETHKAKFLTLLRIHGATKVVVHFSGGGDSGELERPQVLNQAGDNITEAIPQLEWTFTQSAWDDTHTAWKEKTELKNLSIEDIISDLADKLIESTGVDWYNNEGGSGQLVIDFTSDPPTVTVEMSEYETITHDHSFDYSERFFNSEDTDEEEVAEKPEQPMTRTEVMGFLKEKIDRLTQDALAASKEDK